jgi:hypothetical protein
MNVEPIINVKFKKFRDTFELNNVKDGIAFERFVNHAILSGHQPDAFGSDPELLDLICVGGSDDMGIDGIGIKLNGLLVKDKLEVKDIVDKFQRVSVEFIFIQSKMRPEFDSGEFMKFTSGVRDFLLEDHLQPRNEKINNALAIKDFLLSDDVVAVWENNPSVRLYYVAMGTWRDSPHLNAYATQFQSDIAALLTYSECNVHFVDAAGLKATCDNNENTFTTSLETIDTMPLTEVAGVKNSCVALCYASEFMKLLSTEEGIIRKSLFDDNVRDYQGFNNVNEEISQTIKSEPEKFALLNNGITIVCDEYTPSNRRITLKNPQIVNGCQTSHVLYFAGKNGCSIEKIPLHIKIISTSDLDVTNQIVRGTNRQNIVYDEAFEATKIFHKELEDFFRAISQDYQQIYYERRSKQFQDDPRIKQTEKINLKTLTQYSVAILLNKPHMSHRHEAKLLEEFGDKIFLKHQSKLPYYAVSLMFINAEKIFRSEESKYKRLQSFRPHILMMLREMICGPMVDLNSEKKVDAYIQPLLRCVTDPESIKANLERATSAFESATEHWTDTLHRSPDGRKDIQDFTTLLLESISSSQSGSSAALNYGEVVRISTDRRGKKYGLIRRSSSNLFFHSSANPDVDFNNLLGSVVSYTLSTNPRNDRPIATNVRRVEEG